MATPKGPKESVLTTKILKALKEHGVLAWKNHGSPYSYAGVPDVPAVYRGITYYLEVKRPGEEPTPIQLAMHRKLREAGAPVAVVHSPEEATAFVLRGFAEAPEQGFAKEEAAVANAPVDPRVPPELACPNCGARSLEGPAWHCGTCQVLLPAGVIMARGELRKELDRLDKLAAGPAGRLVRQFAFGPPRKKSTKKRG